MYVVCENTPMGISYYYLLVMLICMEVHTDDCVKEREGTSSLQNLPLSKLAVHAIA
jgi:hypothetical protein